MKTALTLALLVSLALPTLTLGATSASGLAVSSGFAPARVHIAAARPGETPVVVSVPANYLALEIRIESDESDWSLKLAGIEETRRDLATAAARGKFQLKIDRALVFQTGHQKSFFPSSSSGGRHDAHSDILILAPISADTDLVPVVRRIHSLVTDLKPARKVTVATGNLFLALDDPELHRAELLRKIRAHLETTSRSLGETGSLTVTGLDAPLRLRQSGERQIDVYLPFQATYSPATRAN